MRQTWLDWWELPVGFSKTFNATRFRNKVNTVSLTGETNDELISQGKQLAISSCQWNSGPVYTSANNNYSSSIVFLYNVLC